MPPFPSGKRKEHRHVLGFLRFEGKRMLTLKLSTFCRSRNACRTSRIFKDFWRTRKQLDQCLQIEFHFRNQTHLFIVPEKNSKTIENKTDPPLISVCLEITALARK